MKTEKEIDLANEVYLLAGYVEDLLKAFDLVMRRLPEDTLLSNEERRAIFTVDNIRCIMAEWEKEE